MTLHFPSHKAVITRHARSLFALGCLIQHITAVNLTDETDLEILSKWLVWSSCWKLSTYSILAGPVLSLPCLKLWYLAKVVQWHSYSFLEINMTVNRGH